jgi:hypothetical protein
MDDDAAAVPLEIDDAESVDAERLAVLGAVFHASTGAMLSPG